MDKCVKNSVSIQIVPDSYCNVIVPDSHCNVNGKIKEGKL